MINEHVSDSDLQLYALTPDAVQEKTAGHIEHCDHCMAAVSIYQFIAGEIKEAPKPSFDFDLGSLVLQQLPLRESTSSRGSFLIWAWICISMLIIAPMYIFQANLAELFKGISVFVIYSLAAATLIILGFSIFEMYRKYQNKMNILNF